MVSAMDQPVFPAAVLLATISFVLMLLIIPPMFWHFRNRNIGAMALVAWTVIALLFNFVNALIWPNDNIGTWYNGVGLCDIETKIQVASQVALPASFACVLRALAKVLDTQRATLIQTSAQRRRNYMVEILWCLGFPLLQMPLQYIVQPLRYHIVGIAGCAPSLEATWLTLLLIVLPPTIWIIIDTYYAVLILIRLYQYRLTFNAILAISSTTKSRFMRLYIICLLWISCALPVQAYVIYANAAFARSPFNWSQTHNAANWHQLVVFRSNGNVLYDRWIPIGTGVVVFVFFGLGKEALSMYRTGLLAIGLGKIVPSLHTENNRSITNSVDSFSSKARMLFKRKNSPSTTSSWTSDSKASMTNSATDPTSPKKTDFVETIDEKSGDLGRTQKAGPESSYDSEAVKSNNKRSFLKRMTSIARTKEHQSSATTETMLLSDLAGQPGTVQAVVSGGKQTPSLVHHQNDTSNNHVLVKTVVRQSSEPY